MLNEKEIIRRKMKSLRAKLSEEDALAKSAQIQATLFGLPEFTKANIISFYVAKKEDREVETEHMIKKSLKMNKRVLVPVVDRETEKLSFCELKDYDSELERGAFGILEPKPSCRRERPLHQTDLVIVPGVAFDSDGHRLGYGNGYYDRALQEVSSRNPEVPFIGLAYDFQVVDELPHEEGDVPVNKIVTESRTLPV